MKKRKKGDEEREVGRRSRDRRNGKEDAGRGGMRN
jgi:hypothetical protein